MVHSRQFAICARLKRLRKCGKISLYGTIVALMVILVVATFYLNYQAASGDRPAGLFQRDSQTFMELVDLTFENIELTVTATEVPITTVRIDSTQTPPRRKATPELYNTVWDTSLKHTDRIVEQMNYVPANMNTSKDIVILATGMTGAENLYHGNQQFIRDQCPVSNCFLTTPTSKYPPRVNYPDAVITSDQFSLPWLLHKRTPETIWIYYMLESPLAFEVADEIKFGIFNWTATYRQDSTIVAPYEKWVPYHNISQFQWRLEDQRNFTLDNGKNFAEGKTRLVATIMSNCDSSYRNMFLEELQKYVEVDVYGACGDWCGDNEDCFGMLQTDYKFYLAFENANCDDYITEKLFRNALSWDVVPVVFGAPVEDYIRSAPPLSFIHIENFNSMRHLAEYLKVLDADDDLYNSYFRWKEQGEFINTKFWCRLCAMLNDLDKPRMVVNDLEDWWVRRGNCRFS